MNVAVIGSGGREHALCYALSKSPQLDTLYAIPGNPGMSEIATCVSIDPLDFNQVVSFCTSHDIMLVIPGSEVYLEQGIHEAFQGTNIKVFGPTKAAAQIETSKTFAKELMKKYTIPTADYAVFTTYQEALEYIKKESFPVVLKYDGLAGGKGVVIASTLEEADEALQDMLLHHKYGHSSVVIEEFLEGPEFSLMCFVHGTTIIPMPIAQDHKRLLDNDQGPNTGGMGIYSSVPMIDEETVQTAINTIMKPVVKAMNQEGTPFTGFLYGGLMATKQGPKVIEFNCRFGDPEAEVILPKLQSDIIEIITNILSNKVVQVQWDDAYYVGVVMASKGYPAAYQKGFEITGLDKADDMIFHMGTTTNGQSLVTNGGRVLLVVGHGNTLQEAITKAYNNVKTISCDNLMYRSDIGYKSL